MTFLIIWLILTALGTATALRMVRHSVDAVHPAPGDVSDMLPTIPPAPRVPSDMAELEREIYMLEQAGM